MLSLHKCIGCVLCSHYSHRHVVHHILRLLVDAHEYYAMFMTNNVPSPMDHSLEIHCVSTSNKNYVRLTTGHINRRLPPHKVEKSVIQEVELSRDETILFTVPGYYRAKLSRSGYFDTQYKVSGGELAIGTVIASCPIALPCKVVCPLPMCYSAISNIITSSHDIIIFHFT